MSKSCNPDSTSTPTVSRRSLAGGAAALLGMAGAAKAALPSPDGELIELCAAFDALEHQWMATAWNAVPYSQEDKDAEAERDRIIALQQPLLDEICACRPTSTAGFIAVATTLALWDKEALRQDPTEDGYWNTRLTSLLLRSMTGRA